jgi:hypothetical protein
MLWFSKDIGVITPNGILSFLNFLYIIIAMGLFVFTGILRLAYANLTRTTYQAFIREASSCWASDGW